MGEGSGGEGILAILSIAYIDVQVADSCLTCIVIQGNRLVKVFKNIFCAFERKGVDTIIITDRCFVLVCVCLFWSQRRQLVFDHLQRQRPWEHPAAVHLSAEREEDKWQICFNWPADGGFHMF